MGDLISRRAAELALLEKGQRSTRYKLGDIWELNFYEIHEALSDVPDASEIIRCKDCKFYAAYDYTGKLMCKRIGKGMIFPKPKDYCSYAERITDKE